MVYAFEVSHIGNDDAQEVVEFTRH
ncbi:uncharacterized protein METZ01_LOCUS50214 [marine metagenome]|uniref:Uncharacterized protein n=1 Tax=marine metagenome TaxID=408172 RepID=A0A381RZY0_9ZZZZ